MASEARAYRPFDGTDADVAGVGEFELELGPAHFYRRAGYNYIIAPATVLNLGFAKDLEAVVDFRDFVALRPVPGESRVRLLDTDVLLKWVMRRGSLQGRTGVSLALEAGPLLPEIEGQTRFGLQADFIGSYRWTFGTLHANEQAARSRRGNWDVFSGVILEGPGSLAIRPVAEVFAEREFEVGWTYSGLIGAIWPVSDAVAFDGGVRGAREIGADAVEVRLGFTWTEAVWAGG